MAAKFIGTCGACGQRFKVNAKGRLCRHGYLRPGDGQEHGQCFGNSEEPHEVSADCATVYLGLVRGWLSQARERHAELVADRVESFTAAVTERSTGRHLMFEEVKRDDARFARCRQNATTYESNRIFHLELDERRLVASLVDWAPKPLQPSVADVDPLPIAPDGTVMNGAYRFVSIGQRGMARRTYYRVEEVATGAKLCVATLAHAKRAVLAIAGK